MTLLVWFCVLGAMTYTALYLASCSQMDAEPGDEGSDAVSDGRLYRWIGLFMTFLGLIGAVLMALGPIVTIGHLFLAAPLVAGGRLVLVLGTRRYRWNGDGLVVEGLMMRPRHYPWESLETVNRRAWLGAHMLSFGGGHVVLPDGMHGGDSLVRAARQRLAVTAF